MNYKNTTQLLHFELPFLWEEIKFGRRNRLYIFWLINLIHLWTISYIINVSRLTHHINMIFLEKSEMENFKFCLIIPYVTNIFSEKWFWNIYCINLILLVKNICNKIIILAMKQCSYSCCFNNYLDHILPMKLLLHTFQLLTTN